MSEHEKVRGILLAHGDMAKGLVDAVAHIAGLEEGAIRAVSNEGKSPETLQTELNEFLGHGPVIIFTDLPSGSCALSARRCCREGSEEAVIFGVNLPILLDFVFHRELPLNELVPRLVAKGRAGIDSAPGFEVTAS